MYTLLARKKAPGAIKTALSPAVVHAEVLAK
jgi:hypothetical protein